MYKYVLNSVVKISLRFAKYFEYYTIILRGEGRFLWPCCSYSYFCMLISEYMNSEMTTDCGSTASRESKAS